MTLLDRAAGLALAVLALAGVMWLSNAPTTVHGAGDAVLRLAWSALPERVERCRQAGEEELAALPAHMRQRLVCEGGSAQYRLTARIQGRVAWEHVAHGGGLRQDRRLYIMRELPMPVGDVPIEVRFDRIDAVGVPPEADPDQRDANDRDGRSRQGAGAETIPAHLELRRQLRVNPRTVTLVTYSQERHALVAIQSTGDAR